MRKLIERPDRRGKSTMVDVLHKLAKRHHAELKGMRDKHKKEISGLKAMQRDELTKAVKALSPKRETM